MSETPASSRNPFDSADNSAMFDQAVADCIRRLEDGKHIDESWLATHYPDWQLELKAFIADWDAFEGYSNDIRNLPINGLGGANLPEPFDGYEVLERVGMGGMGVIYKAKQTSLSRIVAIKMLHNVRHDRRRFQVEAEAVALLDHPNIVSVYEVGEHEGQPYFTMPFISGRDLGSLTEHGEILAPRLAAEVASKIATAVHYAHSRGILHRDLKPGNILLDESDEPHVTDFGLAKNIDASDQLTRTNAIVGTPAYMAPEQALGRNTDVSVATDVYGIGTILYAMLTGRAPHSGNSSMEVLRRVIEATPRGLSSSAVTYDLKVICEKCLEKSPGDRYDSAGQLANDLRRYLAGEPIQAKPVTKFGTALRWARRNPTLSVVGLAACTALMLALVALSLLLRSEYGARTLAEDGQRRERILNAEVQERLNGENAARKRAELTLNEAYANYADSAQRSDRPNEAFLWLCAAGLDSPHERSEANRRRIAAWMQRIPRPIFAYHAADVELAAFDPSSRWLLCSREDKRKFLIFDLEAGRPVPIQIDSPPTTVTWGHQPGILWFGTKDGRLVRIDCASSQSKVVTQVSSPIHALAVSKSRNRVALGLRDRVVLLDLESASHSQYSTSLPSPPLDLQFCCEEKYLLATCEERVYRKDVAKLRLGEEEENAAVFPYVLRSRKTLPTAETRALFYPCVYDDTKLAVLDLDGERSLQIKTFDVRSAEMLYSSVLGVSYANSRPRNGLIVNGGNSAARVRTVRGAGHSERILHDYRVSRCAMSHDGKLVATADRQIIRITECTHLREMRGGEEDDLRPPLAVIPHASRISDLQFSPDNRLLATLQFDGLIRVWDVASARQPRTDVTVEEDGNRAKLCYGPAVYLAGNNRRKFTVNRLQSINLDAGTAQELVADIDGQLRDVATSADDRSIALAIARNRANTGYIRILPTRKFQEGSNAGDSSDEILVELPANPRAMAAHPSKHRYAVLCSNSETVLVEGDTGETLARFTAGPRFLTGAVHPRHNGLIEFSRDGNLIVQVGNKMSEWVYVLDANNCRPRFPYLRNPGGMVQQVDISPDGQTVALAGGRSERIRFYSLQSGEQVAEPIKHPSVVHSARFSPNGQFIVSGCRDGQARIFEWRTGKLLTRALEQSRDVKEACFTADGKSVVTISSDKLAKVWDIQTGLQLSPPIFIGDGMRFLTYCQDLNIAIASGDNPNVVLLPLEQPKLDKSIRGDELFLLAELVSYATIIDGGTVRLTTEGWMKRWNQFRETDLYRLSNSDLATIGESE